MVLAVTIIAAHVSSHTQAHTLPTCELSLSLHTRIYQDVSLVSSQI